MKRFFFWFLVGMAAIGVVRSNRHRPFDDDREHDHAPRPLVVHRIPGPGHDGASGRKILVVERDGRRILIDSHGVRVDHRTEADRDRDHDDDTADDRRDRDTERALERALAQAERDGQRVAVEGLPVPVVPGSLTTEARPEPPRPPAPPEPPKPPKPPKHRRVTVKPAPPMPPKEETPASELVVIQGRRSATEGRARQDARTLLEKRVGEWLEPEVPKSWTPSTGRIDRLVRETRITPIERDYGTVYEAELKADLSPARRASIVDDYRREQTYKKLGLLGAGLGFVLVCLASLSGYIRADEATRGYYTNRLRMATAVGVGAAGVALYRWLA